MRHQIQTFSLFCLIFIPLLAWSQSSTLPAPSRTVFKCNASGKMVYSDEPCRGAERLDITPTRGLNQITGKERTGSDVAKEKYREMFSDALKPVTGLNREQYEATHRRFKLSAEDKKACSNLDTLLEKLEKKGGSGVEFKAEQDEEKYVARKKFRDLRC